MRIPGEKTGWVAVAILLGVVLGAKLQAAFGGRLEDGFTDPPPEARVRAYWWWLNGNVTKEAITRDLEEMAAKGFGGALICDAGGAEQWGNAPVPHGPTFFSPEWRELYKHALREADRLGLEISLNIQSGWNLGGPMVRVQDAPKKLVWSETRVHGPGPVQQALEEPRHPPELYNDVAVLAYPIRAAGASKQLIPHVTARSAQAEHPAALAVDGDDGSFWVSENTTPGRGPSKARPEWLRFDLPAPAALNHLRLQPRDGYGPRNVAIQVSGDGGTWQTIKEFALRNGEPGEVDFELVESGHFRLQFSDAFDPRHPDSPRNVQVTEVRWSGPEYSWPGSAGSLKNWAEKALHKALHFSAPETHRLLDEGPSQPNERITSAKDVLDLTAKMTEDGVLNWGVPAGEWEVLRFGFTLNDHCRVSTHSDGWSGYALDPFDANAFQAYWKAIVEPLIADAGPLAGKALKYLHTDSWEVEVANWAPGLREAFQTRRGYDLWPYLPVVAGKIVDSRPVSNRFLNDFRRTMGDLAIDHHYRIFKESAHRHGLQIHPESGGPHAVPVDSLQCLGHNDVPMSEFWAWSWQHRIGDRNRFFVKQPASAAHTYGHNLVAAEGFTTIGPHWQERVWDNLRPAFDQAVCEGLNRLVWHTFTCSPQEMGVPGQEYFAGTHFNPNSTWWDLSGAFLTYLNRTQFMLQRGLFVADVVYYYGNHVPNFAQLKASDPAGVLPGYDYDVATEEVVLTRMSVEDGRIQLPDGMSYRVLVLPERDRISLPVLRKVKELVTAGATVIGPKPVESISLERYPECDVEVQQLADRLWGEMGASEPIRRSVGKGRILSGTSARDVLLADGVPPDFQASSGAGASLDYIHRRDGDTEIYFIANRSNGTAVVECTFRVSGLAPELWNAVTGERQFAAAYQETNERTMMPMEFDPCGSWFVVFRKPAAEHPPTTKSNTREFKPLQELTGPWTVTFDPERGGPASVEFDTLTDWTQRPEPGIKYYSGTATYMKEFDISQSAIFLDLGDVREMARVTLNGQSVGILWTPPFQVEITNALKPRGNLLQIEVVNFWPNRIIGDAALPQEQRRTRTNIRKLTADTRLMPSGLLGPVRLLESLRPARGSARFRSQAGTN